MKIIYTKKFSLDNMKIGHFTLFQGQGFYSRNIKAKQLKAGFTKDQARFTHIEVCCGGQNSLTVMPFQPIHIIDIREKHKGKFIRVVKYKGKEYNRKRYKVALWAVSKSNLRYDIFGIISFLLKFIKQNTKKFFCSELALYALQKEYPEALDSLEPDQCMPAHFTTEELDVVWEGYIT